MDKKFKLLIVEDEPAIRTGLVDVFIYHGYAVDSSEDGLEGLHRAVTNHYDLVLLDVMLPSMNGFDICDEIRTRDSEQPIIMLTAKVTEDDIITGLRLGADDYIAKPFSVTELVLRVEAVLRRTRHKGTAVGEIQLGDLKIDTRNLSGDRLGIAISFTRREMEILTYLHSNADRPVSREELLSEVWGYSKAMDIETRTVDIHMAKLRRKIEDDAKNPQFLTTVRGAGYRLIP
jgi:two-component system response regulator RegX3